MHAVSDEVRYMRSESHKLCSENLIDQSGLANACIATDKDTNNPRFFNTDSLSVIPKAFLGKYSTP